MEYLALGLNSSLVFHTWESTGIINDLFICSLEVIIWCVIAGAMIPGNARLSPILSEPWRGSCSWELRLTWKWRKWRKTSTRSSRIYRVKNAEEFEEKFQRKMKIVISLTPFDMRKFLHKIPKICWTIMCLWSFLWSRKCLQFFIYIGIHWMKGTIVTLHVLRLLSIFSVFTSSLSEVSLTLRLKRQSLFYSIPLGVASQISIAILWPSIIPLSLLGFSRSPNILIPWDVL